MGSGRKNRGRKQWRNQRKTNPPSHVKDDGGDGGGGGNRGKGDKNFILTVVDEGNFKMESYYAVQGLHDHGYAVNDDYDDDDKNYQSWSSLEEWNVERLKWRSRLGEVLPASFRFTMNLSQQLKQSMENELYDLLQQARDWKPTANTAAAAAATEVEEVEKEVKKEQQQQVAEEETKTNEPKEPIILSSQQQEESAKQEQQQQADAADSAAPVEAATVEEDQVEEGTRTAETITPTKDVVVYEPLSQQDTAIYKIPFLEYAYQLSILDRGIMRKHPALQPLHQWLIQQTECGHLTRQETVSMIPPVILLAQAAQNNNNNNNNNKMDGNQDEKPNRSRGGLCILDMCAAPGSKTSQLLEGLAVISSDQKQQQAGGVSDFLDPSHSTGLLVANDVNPQRANMLTHQLKRLIHHFPVAVVTAAPAQSLSIYQDPSATCDKSSPAQFDLILADVPCSGDGTSRKNINVWSTWSQMGALALHKLQLDIAWRGIAQLCRVGGYVCYSTCSMNPMENEAVVAELLRRAPAGTLELIDCRPIVKQFKTRPGMNTWKVLCEASTRKQMKNRDNKHKPAVQAKRQQHEQETTHTTKEKTTPTNKEEGDTKKGEDEEEMEDTTMTEPKDSMTEDTTMTEPKDSTTDPMIRVVDEASTTAADAVSTMMIGDGNEHARDKATAALRFDPESHGAQELLRIATEEAGFLNFESMDQVPQSLSGRIRPSCFPPTDKENEEFHLERCLRVLAQDNNTGNFFVALFHKTAPIGSFEKRRATRQATPIIVDGDDTIPTDGPILKRAKVNGEQEEEKEDKENIKQDDKNNDEAVTATTTTAVDGETAVPMEEDDAYAVAATAAAAASGEEPMEESTGKNDNNDDEGKTNKNTNNNNNNDRRGGGGGRQRNANAEFVPIKDEILDPLIEHYGLGGPTFRRDIFMTRSQGDSKIVYMIAPAVKDILFDQGKIQERVNIISTGLKAFTRNTAVKDTPVTHRLAQEAAHFMVPYMKPNQRKFSVSLSDFEACLSSERVIQFTTFSDEFATKLKAIDIGAFCVVLEGFEDKQADKMVLVMWRCRGENCNTLVSKAEQDAIQSKLALWKKQQQQQQSETTITKDDAKNNKNDPTTTTTPSEALLS